MRGGDHCRLIYRLKIWRHQQNFNIRAINVLTWQLSVVVVLSWQSSTPNNLHLCGIQEQTDPEEVVRPFGPLKLDTVVIEGMGPQIIVSVSQVCQLGHVPIFTSKDFRVYTLRSVLCAMKVLTLDGKEIVRGTVHNGLYIQDST